MPAQHAAVQAMIQVSTMAHIATSAHREDPIADHMQAQLFWVGCAQTACGTIAARCSSKGGCKGRPLTRQERQLLVLPGLTCCTFLEASAFACLSWSCSCLSKPRVSSTISLSLASLASFLLADSSAFRSRVSAVSLLMRAASSSCRRDGMSASKEWTSQKTGGARPEE